MLLCFLIDTYGLKKLKRFFKEIGKTGDLNAAFEKVYKRSESQMEAEWHSYIKASHKSGGDSA